MFNPAMKKDIDLLESIQNSFTRKLVMRCFSIDHNIIRKGPQRADLFGLPSLKNRRKDAYIMMYKIFAENVFIDPTDFFGGILTRSVRGKLKLRVSVTKSRVRSDFLTYRALKEFNLLLGKHDDLRELSVQTCRRFFSR